MAEVKIADGQGPKNIGKWKKEDSDKLGILDKAYEKFCVEFLDYYISQKNS